MLVDQIFREEDRSAKISPFYQAIMGFNSEPVSLGAAERTRSSSAAFIILPSILIPNQNISFLLKIYEAIFRRFSSLARKQLRWCRGEDSNLHGFPH